MLGWWQMWHRGMSETECNWILENRKALHVRSGLIGGQGTVSHEDGVMRRSQICWVPRQTEWEWLWSKVWQHFKEANRNFFGFDVSDLPSIQLGEYDATYKGHYDWHEDLDFVNPRPFQRKLSLIVQLSNPTDYDGGEFLIDHDQPAAGTPDHMKFRDRGTIIVFPSFLRHKVMPVTRGTRNSLVSWAEGPNFR
jgi:PKHD-type hydroxylase